MPYDLKNNILFIHIPKNAGTSISRSLNMYHNHYRYLYYTQILDENQLSSLYKFCVVRNPWDRIVSCYTYAKMLHSYYHSPNKTTLYEIHPDYELLKYKSFLECVKLLRSNPEKFKHESWLNQKHWITDQHDNIVMDEIFMFENLEKLSYKFNFLKIPHINISTRKKDYKYYYDAESYNIVCELYNVDITEFNYTF